MNMRYARSLIAGSAAVLAAILGATAALAATTWTIKPGGAISSTATNVNFKDTKTEDPHRRRQPALLQRHGLRRPVQQQRPADDQRHVPAEPQAGDHQPVTGTSRLPPSITDR